MTSSGTTPAAAPVTGPTGGPLRVLVVTTVHTPLDARIHHRQIRALRAAGAHVVQAAPWSATGTDPDDAVEGVRPVDLPRARGRRRVAALWAARRTLRRMGPSADVILLHDPELVLAALGQLHRLPPVLLDVHEDLPASLSDRAWIPRALRPAATRVAAALERLAVRRLAGVLLAEHSYRERLGTAHPVIPNLPWLPPEVLPAGTHRRVVYLGRLSSGRGVDEVLALGEALSAAATSASEDRAPDAPHATDDATDDTTDDATDDTTDDTTDDARPPPIEVVLIGPADAEVQDAVRAAHAAGTVTWHGFLPNDQALAIVAGSIAGLAPLHDLANYHGSMPTKVVEYLAHGVPAVVTPLPQARELVEAADAGVVVPFADTAALVAAVRDLAADPVRTRDLGVNGRRYVAAHRSWDANAPGFVYHLAGVASARRSPAPARRSPAPARRSPAPARRAPTSRARAVLVALVAGVALSVLAPAPLPAAAAAPACPEPLPGVVASLHHTPDAVALTIDDGPHPVHTPQMLEVLAGHDVRATFFVIGRNVRDHPELARRIVDAGHLLANHTFSHPTRPDHMDAIDLADRVRELDRATRVIEDATGVTPCFFRGPQGHHRSPETIALANERGMTVSGWTVSSLDVLQPPERDEAAIADLVAGVTEPLRPGGVLLFHDGGGAPKPNSAPAVDRVIERYLDAGYRFVDPAGRDIPAVNGTIAPLCPARVRLTSSFRDVSPTSPHQHAIACAQDRGVLTGRSEIHFAPDQPVTRGQLATALDRHLARAGIELDGTLWPFPDVEGSVHTEAIERLAGAGLLAGRADGTFGPDTEVRRDQLATMLHNVLARAHGHEVELAGAVGFADVAEDHPHAAGIAGLHSIEVVSGRGADRFDPAAPVTRAQAASMLVRLEVHLAGH